MGHFDFLVRVRQKSLTATPRHLERGGLITPTVKAQVPIRVDYDATDLGRTMVAEVHPLWMWVAVNLHAFTKAAARSIAA